VAERNNDMYNYKWQEDTKLISLGTLRHCRFIVLKA